VWRCGVLRRDERRRCAPGVRAAPHDARVAGGLRERRDGGDGAPFHRPSIEAVDALRQVGGWPAETVAVAVLRGGEEVGTLGPREHVFRWASVTKPVTALATLVAAEEGILDLDDPAGPP